MPTPGSPDLHHYGLSDRERRILRLVVQEFVDTAGPIGSRYLSSQFGLGLSPASIRSTMSELEARGFLDHPYTSAGRVPTERGYRAYVDELMDQPRLSNEDQVYLKAHLKDLASDADRLVRETSRLLGQFANLLGVALSPRLSTGVLDRLEIVPLSSTRVMFVISIRGGLIRTIILHADSELSRPELERVVSLLNDRLAGLTLEEIRKTCRARVHDLSGDETGLVRMLMDASPTLFSEPPENRRLEVDGTSNMIVQPEFQQPEDVRELLAMLDDNAAVVSLLGAVDDANDPVAQARIRIGSENVGADASEQFRRYSVVTAPYQRANMRGTIGVIGPKRMNYTRVVALVEGMAALLSWALDDEDTTN